MTLDLGIDVSESKSGRWFKYFSSWAYIACVLYFLFAFFLTFMEVCQIFRKNLHGRRSSRKTRDPYDVEMEVPHEGRYRNREFDDPYDDMKEEKRRQGPGPNTKNNNNKQQQDIVDEDESLSIQFKLMWFLENIAITASGVVTIAYWTIIRDSNESLDVSLKTYLTIDRHGIVFLFMLSDFLYNRIPFRALHLVYPLSFGLLYLAFHLANWEITGETVYSGTLDWDAHPGHTLAYFTAMLLGIIVVHLLLRIIHKCKFCR